MAGPYVMLDLYLRSDKGLIKFDDAAPIFTENMFSWFLRIHHDIGRFHSRKILNIRPCGYLFFFLFVNDRTPFTDSSVAGHNILHRLTSTVSYESQTLRQEVTTLSPLINKHYERQLLSINQSYINYFFAVKAYYNDLLWYGRTPNR